MNDCLFCKIIKGEIPYYKVYEDKNTLAFLDITPNTEGHTLLIPKKHSRNLLEIEDDDFKNLTPAIKKVANLLKNSLKADGVNVSSNNEKVAGQVIFHTHIHIIPRYEDDGLIPWKGKEMSKENLEKIKNKITDS